MGADRTDSFLEPLRIQEDPARRGSMRFPVTNVVDVLRDFSTGDHDTAGLHLLTVAVLRRAAGRPRPALAGVVHAVRGRIR